MTARSESWDPHGTASTIEPAKGSAMTRVAQWAAEEGVGAEHLVLNEEPDRVIGEAVVVGTRFGMPYGAHYRVEMAPDWTVRRVLVALTDGRALVVSADGNGHWHDIDGKPLATLDGCIDLPRHSRIPCQSAGSG